MKTLYLLRHAKSSWDHPNLTDFQRPLSDRGLNAAPLIGKTMLEKGLMPDRIVSSPAERARQTAALVRDTAGIECEIRFDERIYGAGASDILEIVSELEETAGSAMLVGHNPTFENTVGVLTGEFRTMPTASLAVIDLEITGWSEIGPDCGSLRMFLRPKNSFDLGSAK